MSRRVLPFRLLIWAAGAAVLTTVTASCRDTDGREPVATVAVELDRDAIPLGAPATFSFRFVVSPAHTPLSEDYRVMVHFLDGNGEMMWAADHDPAVPTTEWQPGQTVSYSHQVRIPMYPYIGESVVAVGLYSLTTGERLPLAGEDLGQRAYRGTTVSLEPQPESGFLVYQDGWHDDEFSPATGERWRWTGERAGLSFRNPRSDAVLYLEFDGRADLFEPAQRVNIRIGDQVVFETEVSAPERELYEIALAAEVLGQDDTVTLVLDVDRTFVPADLAGGPGDDRALGVRVFYAFIEPR